MNSDLPRIFFSFRRLWTIATNTMTEVIRQKFFYILLVFGILFLVASVFIEQFSSTERIKFIKDFGLGVITIFGAVIAIVGTAELLPMELENRTIYPILAKPVYRAEFLLGKFTGMIMLILLTVLLMSVIFGVILFYVERGAMALAISEGTQGDVSPAEIIRQVQMQTRDPKLLLAIGLIYFKLVIVCSIGLVIGTIATSVIFNVICNTILYICGHLVTTARQEWIGNPSATFKPFLGIIVFFIPDLNFFNVADAVVLGQPLPTNLVFEAVGYCLFYSLVVLLVAHFIFENKEI
jgi:ABC-type transport system involved in multi-copper enzyme maturation permease subunit